MSETSPDRPSHTTEATSDSVIPPPPRSAPSPSLLPKRIGRYSIRRLLGAGGMGCVYEAMQERPHRVVALKVLKAGIASRSALRRFEYESQLLGRLRHPGIAEVYEAGTCETEGGEEGVPFFAMEYIAGARRITDFASEKKLDTRQRIELFIAICEAVHGHTKGVIHRDLKPDNILVDSDGRPKVIDFDVARATDADMAVTTLQTEVGQLIGTVQYMSPEQVELERLESFICSLALGEREKHRLIVQCRWRNLRARLWARQAGRCD